MEIGCCFVCNECPLNFKTLGDLEEHLHDHQKSKPSQIQTQLEESEEPMDDQMIVESSSSPTSSISTNFDDLFKSDQIACRLCQKQFTDRDQLNVHYTHTHRDKPQYECEICHQVFGIKRELSTHLRTHSGEQPHKCDKCGKEFGTRQLLKKHDMWHTGQRSHVCETCGKAFFQKGHLTQHLMIHKGGRPHKCALCEKTFIFKFDLNRHMKIHAERGHSCRVCQKSFASQLELENHACRRSPKRENTPLSDVSRLDSTFSSPLQNSPYNGAKSSLSERDVNQYQLKLVQLMVAAQQQRLLQAANEQQQRVLQAAFGQMVQQQGAQNVQNGIGATLNSQAGIFGTQSGLQGAQNSLQRAQNGLQTPQNGLQTPVNGLFGIQNSLQRPENTTQNTQDGLQNPHDGLHGLFGSQNPLQIGQNLEKRPKIEQNDQKLNDDTFQHDQNTLQNVPQNLTVNADNDLSLQNLHKHLKMGVEGDEVNGLHGANDKFGLHGADLQKLQLGLLLQQHSCTLCGQQFENQQMLAIHVQMHQMSADDKLINMSESGTSSSCASSPQKASPVSVVCSESDHMSCDGCVEMKSKCYSLEKDLSNAQGEVARLKELISRLSPYLAMINSN
ncbi:unnamed protein product [Bursaphelenchus okinawaensis]|uniref:C2H2-type domain-containing protein n=1 Tax=Bursaphelenchus okinawaensis TaxID=465554 RepID=A0A811KZ44_9BILA|nr:unnamed protein product [Bursaphelenchus okinawaensis]CAG9114630.1 unnamed protein product [Bursaphelenchus okinawaensis]